MLRTHAISARFRLPALVLLLATLPCAITAQAKVSVVVEPNENQMLAYARVAPRTAGGKEGVKLVIKLRIKNEESSQLKLQKVIVNFLGPPYALAMVYPFSNETIAPSQSKTVWLREPSNPPTGQNQFIKLPYPPPPAVRIELGFAGFAKTTDVVRQLVQHLNSTPTGSFRFSSQPGDLLSGRFWKGGTSIVYHSHHGHFEHDLGVVAWDATKNAWSKLKKGKSGDQNDHYRAWDKPVRAVADGVVIAAVDGNNDKPPHNKNLPGGANYVRIRHGVEDVAYYHLQKGTVKVKKDQVVKAGQLIGRVGNSGSTDFPHLHIQVTRNGEPRPMQFHGISVVDASVVDPKNTSAAPWTKLTPTQGRALPFGKIGISSQDATILIRPETVTPPAVLTGSGTGQRGSRVKFLLTAGRDQGRAFALASSLGIGPLQIGNRYIGLQFDELFFLSISGLVPQIFTGYSGKIGSTGTASASILIADVAALVGLKIHSAFVTLAPQNSPPIRSISNTYSFTIK